MVNQTTQILEFGTKVLDGGAFLLSSGMITKTQVILGQKESVDVGAVAMMIGDKVKLQAKWEEDDAS